MWEIEHLDLPFFKAKTTLAICWNLFIENFKEPFSFLVERIQLILDNMHMTPTEVFDVEMSWDEIRKGKARKFTNVDDLLKELRS